jgi:DNA-binding sugar fermentation-stimulating protein
MSILNEVVGRFARIAFGVYCALKVYHEPKFRVWAMRWLNGKDRTRASAASAAARSANINTNGARAANAAANAAVDISRAPLSSADRVTDSIAYANAANKHIDFKVLLSKALEVSR